MEERLEYEDFLGQQFDREGNIDAEAALTDGSAYGISNIDLNVDPAPPNSQLASFDDYTADGNFDRLNSGEGSNEYHYAMKQRPTRASDSNHLSTDVPTIYGNNDYANKDYTNGLVIYENNSAYAKDTIKSNRHSPVLGNSVINIVAPEDSGSSNQVFPNEESPMYSANGVSFHNQNLHVSGELDSTSSVSRSSSSGSSHVVNASSSQQGRHSPIESPMAVPLGSGTSNSRRNSQQTQPRTQRSPMGSPSMLTAPLSSTDISLSPSSSTGNSPVMAGSTLSPYEEPYYNTHDGSVSPLVGADQQYFENETSWNSYTGDIPKITTQSFDQQSYDPSYPSKTSGGYVNKRGSYNNTVSSLQLPSKQRSRAHSDSWSNQARDLFLDSLDARFAAGDEEKRQDLLSFPSYTPFTVHPHSPNFGTRSSGQFNAGIVKNESTSPSRPHYSGVRVNQGATSPRPEFYDYDRNYQLPYNQQHSQQQQHKQHQFQQQQLRQHSQQQLSVSPTTRKRSLSSSYEPTNDLKLSASFVCELCGKKFTRAYNLRSHMRTHTDERPFACQHCGKAFARQHDRKRHEALHSGEKRFTCHGYTHGFKWGCQKRFARADALGRHFRTEAGRTCLRPVIDRIRENGTKKGTAPEGILFAGFVNGKPQLSFSEPPDSTATMTHDEREEHTRRTVIVTAIAEML